MLFRTGLELTRERTQPEVVHGSDRDHREHQSELPREDLADRGEPEVAATLGCRCQESSEMQIGDSGNEEDGARHSPGCPETHSHLPEQASPQVDVETAQGRGAHDAEEEHAAEPKDGSQHVERDRDGIHSA